MRWPGALLILICGSSGCAPLVELARPQPVLSGGWSAGNRDGAQPATNVAEMLGSPELAGLIASALRDNPDIAIASARVDQARAGLRAARASGDPLVSLSLAGRTGASAGAGSGTRTINGEAAVDLAWTPDLSGRRAAERRAEGARAVAAAHDRDAVRLLIETELARAFVQHAALGARIALVDRSLASARELARVIGVRQRLGAATRVETGLQSIEVRQLEVERTRLVQAQHRVRNAMAVLAGTEPPLFTAPGAQLSGLQVPALAPAQPAVLLSRRPDVRAAEARIAAANGDVDVARRSFIPDPVLSIGAASTLLAGPLGAAASIGGDLLAPIFNRGRLRAGLDLASATQREAVETYRRTLLQALREVEDALGDTGQSQQRRDLLMLSLDEARVTAQLARRQYIEGYADLQRVLEAEAGLIEVEDGAVLAAEDRLQAAVDLYRAMGGAPTS